MVGDRYYFVIRECEYDEEDAFLQQGKVVFGCHWQHLVMRERAAQDGGKMLTFSAGTEKFEVLESDINRTAGVLGASGAFNILSTIVSIQEA